MATISKKLTSFCLAVLLCTFTAREANAAGITNAAMERDTTPGCSPLHPAACNDQQANNYGRGCESAELCWGGH
ncbi:hypothetical protein P3X46_027093 [Hevea brasiliensis]|uniref:Uncharacterized protein n=1 Tax=Hevea brasiliensis TaxID=3981 RepID=A0ABQ9KYQ6_HEVBR|nr:hypothetical protein P3X46_027093 [Hevea brasiliensis]